MSETVILNLGGGLRSFLKADVLPLPEDIPKKSRLDEDLRLVRNIDWKSTDKDNMEYITRVSVYQRDALDRLLKLPEALETIANIPPVPVGAAVDAGDVWKKLNLAIATARKALK